MKFLAIRINKKNGEFAGWWNTETSKFSRVNNKVYLSRVIPDKYEARLYDYTKAGISDLVDDYQEIEKWILDNQNDTDLVSWLDNATIEVEGFYSEYLEIEDLEVFTDET